MDSPASSGLWTLIHLILLIKSYTICPLVKFAIAYGLYTLGAILITVLYKLRYQVYNKDLKLKPESCKNRVLLITGAGSGIGLALSHHFHRRGFVIIACCYSKDEPGYKELSDLESSGDGTRKTMHLIELDVRSQGSIDSCYAVTKEILDGDPKLRLHALMNVAGVGVVQRFQWMQRASIKNIVDVNLVGAMLMTRQFLHLLIKNRGSRVVNVASPLGLFPYEMSSVYGPTKAALTHFSGALEADTARYGLRTITIQPGNLIRNTSIISTSLEEKLESVEAELNEEEKRLYQIEMREHSKFMDQMESARKKKTYNLEMSTSAPLKSNIIKFSLLVSGALSTFKLHESKSFVQSFDNAIRLKSPPREMFAGNIFHVIFWDSCFQWASRIILRDIYLNVHGFVKRSLRKRCSMGI